MEKNIEIIENMIQTYKDCSVPGEDMQVDVTFREEQCKALQELVEEYKKLKIIEGNYNAMRLLNYYNERLINGENADDLLDEAHNLFNNKEDK